MIDEFSSHGISLISVSQGIDTSANNAMAKMQLGMLSVFAEFERDLIRERTVAGLRAAQAKGTLLGRPRKIDSYSQPGRGTPRPGSLEACNREGDRNSPVERDEAARKGGLRMGRRRESGYSA